MILSLLFKCTDLLVSQETMVRYNLIDKAPGRIKMDANFYTSYISHNSLVIMGGLILNLFNTTQQPFLISPITAHFMPIPSNLLERHSTSVSEVLGGKKMDTHGCSQIHSIITIVIKHKNQKSISSYFILVISVLHKAIINAMTATSAIIQLSYDTTNCITIAAK